MPEPDNALVKIAPEVRTLARPDSGPLLAARMLVQQTPEIQEVFTKAKKEKWGPDQLALALGEPLQRELNVDDPQKVFAVAQYLADEYVQMGDTVLLISRTTGKAIGRVTDDDLWTPAPVPREDGTMAQPLPRLRPELEAFIISWHFEKDREHQITDALAPGLHQTDLVKIEGDPRLLPVTRAGRNTIVDRLRDNLPALLRTTSGSAGRFLAQFDIINEGDETSAFSDYEPIMRCTALARSVMGIQDRLAMNLRFDRFAYLSGHVANSWAREIARTLGIAAKEHFNPLSQSIMSLGKGDHGIMWVGDPNTTETLVRRSLLPNRNVGVLPVEHAPTYTILRKVGAIVVKPDAYGCQGRELFSRWEVAARMEYTLWIDWKALRAFDFSDVPATGTSVVAR